MNNTTNSLSLKANSIAARWDLSLPQFVVETPRASIFKVQGPYGASALKLYKKIGASGEGAGVSFLQSLDPAVGARVYRRSFWYNVVLMEWLDGPILAKVAESDAIDALGQVAAGIFASTFKYPIKYPRSLPRLKRDLQLCVTDPKSPAPLADLHKILAILDHLTATSASERVVHGDLTVHNIILTSDGPRVIDPKGLRADPAFEFGKGLIIPYGNMAVADFAIRAQSRAEVLAPVVDTPPIRLLQWASVIFARTVFYGARKRPERVEWYPYFKALLELSEL